MDAICKRDICIIFFSFFFKCAWYVGCNIIHDNDNKMSQNKFVLKTFEVDDHDEIMSL